MKLNLLFYTSYFPNLSQEELDRFDTFKSLLEANEFYNSSNAATFYFLHLLLKNKDKNKTNLEIFKKIDKKVKADTSSSMFTEQKYTLMKYHGTEATTQKELKKEPNDVHAFHHTKEGVMIAGDTTSAFVLFKTENGSFFEKLKQIAHRGMDPVSIAFRGLYCLLLIGHIVYRKVVLKDQTPITKEEKIDLAIGVGLVGISVVGYLFMGLVAATAGIVAATFSVFTGIKDWINYQREHVAITHEIAALEKKQKELTEEKLKINKLFKQLHAIEEKLKHALHEQNLLEKISVKLTQHDAKDTLEKQETAIRYDLNVYHMEKVKIENEIKNLTESYHLPHNLDNQNANHQMLLQKVDKKDKKLARKIDNKKLIKAHQYRPSAIANKILGNVFIVAGVTAAFLALAGVIAVSSALLTASSVLLAVAGIAGAVLATGFLARKIYQTIKNRREEVRAKKSLAHQHQEQRVTEEETLQNKEIHQHQLLDTSSLMLTEKFQSEVLFHPVHDPVIKEEVKELEPLNAPHIEEKKVVIESDKKPIPPHHTIN